jgi:hypothetical protein
MMSRQGSSSSVQQSEQMSEYGSNGRSYADVLEGSRRNEFDLPLQQQMSGYQQQFAPNGYGYYSLQ